MAARTLYEVLYLHPTATNEVINAVYRVLAKKYHPDYAGPDAADRMATINEAYSILRDEAKRQAYDASIKAIEDASSGPAGQGSAKRVDGRESAPGATNLKYEDGAWAVRPATEQTPPPPQFGEAGAPPSNLRQAGTVISFGRYRGWTIGQVAAYDRNYVEWLSRTMAGRTYREELLRALGQTN